MGTPLVWCPGSQCQPALAAASGMQTLGHQQQSQERILRPCSRHPLDLQHQDASRQPKCGFAIAEDYMVSHLHDHCGTLYCHVCCCAVGIGQQEMTTNTQQFEAQRYAEPKRLPAYSKRRGKSSSLENSNAFCRVPSPTTTTCTENKRLSLVARFPVKCPC